MPHRDFNDLSVDDLQARLNEVENQGAWSTGGTLIDLLHSFHTPAVNLAAISHTKSFSQDDAVQETKEYLLSLLEKNNSGEGYRVDFSSSEKLTNTDIVQLVEELRNTYKSEYPDLSPEGFITALDKTDRYKNHQPVLTKLVEYCGNKVIAKRQDSERTYEASRNELFVKGNNNKLQPYTYVYESSDSTALEDAILIDSQFYESSIPHLKQKGIDVNAERKFCVVYNYEGHWVTALVSIGQQLPNLTRQLNVQVIDSLGNANEEIEFDLVALPANLSLPKDSSGNPKTTYSRIHTNQQDKDGSTCGLRAVSNTLASINGQQIKQQTQKELRDEMTERLTRFYTTDNLNVGNAQINEPATARILAQPQAPAPALPVDREGKAVEPSQTVSRSSVAATNAASTLAPSVHSTQATAPTLPAARETKAVEPIKTVETAAQHRAAKRKAATPETEDNFSKNRRELLNKHAAETKALKAKHKPELGKIEAELLKKELELNKAKEERVKKRTQTPFNLVDGLLSGVQAAINTIDASSASKLLVSLFKATFTLAKTAVSPVMFVAGAVKTEIAEGKKGDKISQEHAAIADKHAAALAKHAKELSDLSKKQAAERRKLSSEPENNQEIVANNSPNKKQKPFGSSPFEDVPAPISLTPGKTPDSARPGTEITRR